MSQSTPTVSAMVLAAGRGERLRPLTDGCPKPLLLVRGKPLVQWSLESLARAGVKRWVFNSAWLAPQVQDYFSRWRAADLSADFAGGFEVLHSPEGRDFGRALETLGGICRALPLLGEVFWVLAADVYMPEFRFSAEQVQRFVASGKLAHLWLVPNPVQHPRGDFGLALPEADALSGATGLALAQADTQYTFSTVALYRRELFTHPWCDIPEGNPEGVVAALAPLLRRAMAEGQVSAQLYQGPWVDVGTPERLAALNRVN